MPTPLEERTAGLFAACDALLGDSVIITPPAEPAIACTAHVEYGEEVEARGISAVVVQQIQVDLAKSLVPGKPGSGWRISFGMMPSRTFEPMGTIDDPKGAGQRWLFRVTEIMNG